MSLMNRDIASNGNEIKLFAVGGEYEVTFRMPGNPYARSIFCSDDYAAAYRYYNDLLR